MKKMIFILIYCLDETLDTYSVGTYTSLMNFISEKGYPDYIIIGSYCYKLVKHDSKSLLLRDYDGDEIEILIKNDEFVYKLI